jgi:hypothetical protein
MKISAFLNGRLAAPLRIILQTPLATGKIMKYNQSQALGQL